MVYTVVKLLLYLGVDDHVELGNQGDPMK